MRALLTRLEAGRGYARRAARRIIRRSGVIAIPNLPSAAGHRIRARAFVASGGTGGAMPLADGRGRAGVVVGRGAVVSGIVFPFAGWVLGNVGAIGNRWVSGPAGTCRRSRAAGAR